MGAPISALSAAREMCERSDWTLTNLELQKMLYLAQMVYMGEHEGEPLFNGRFEAWDYGPVLPEVYSRARAFGSAPIMDVFHGARPIMDSERREFLASAYDQLSTRRAADLVNITHWSKGAWYKYYRPGSKGIVIPDEAIYQEAKDRAVATAK